VPQPMANGAIGQFFSARRLAPSKHLPMAAAPSTTYMHLSADLSSQQT
jgi:hypothetical protein